MRFTKYKKKILKKSQKYKFIKFKFLKNKINLVLYNTLLSYFLQKNEIEWRKINFKEIRNELRY